jgi:hypothetical protein
VSAYWASIEVFTVGIVAMTIEISPITIFLVDFITGGTCSSAKQLLSQILGPEEGQCLIAGAEIEWGFALGFLAMLTQIGTGAVFLRASGVAIRDREDVLENRPHQEWTMWEYRVLNVLLVHGAEHHKPQPGAHNHGHPPKPNIFQRCNRDPGAVLWSLNPFKCFCEGIKDISTPIGQNPQHGASTNKWNAPAQSSKYNSPAPSGQWNMAPPQSGQWNAPPQQSGQWNAPPQQSGQWGGQSGQWGGQGGGQSGQWPSANSNQIAPQNPMMESSNPVFAAEANKRFSVDV